MDFIKKLISGILGFVSGILGFATGLLPGKKKSNGYFLELEEATSQSNPAVSSVKKAQEAVAVAASQAAKSPEPAKATKTATKTKVEASQNGKAAKAEPAKAAAATVKTPTETTFAPKYLAPSTTSSNGRRRPGANMSAYLEMARQIKTPNN